jgi:hypothetical protein
MFDAISYSIHLRLGYEIVRFIKRRTVSSTGQVSMVEVTVGCHMAVTTTKIYDKPKKIDENRITHSLKLRPFMRPPKHAGHLFWSNLAASVLDGL